MAQGNRRTGIIPMLDWLADYPSSLSDFPRCCGAGIRVQ